MSLRCAIAAAVAATALLAPPTEAAEPPPGEYRIANGRVDAGTYNGWRVFHSACFGCHGTGGVGTDLAPSLVERIKSMTPRAFAAKVLTSYRLVPADDDRNAGREALLDEVMKRDRRARGLVVMPAWESDARVPPHVLDLYAYLNARADGELGPGRPKAAVPQARSPGRTR
ncbi:MAG TPA: cytochrome c [Burkholderiaceae bacterium]|nr:cytochrome c [Burkholderiaceae bacterium]